VDLRDGTSLEGYPSRTIMALPKTDSLSKGLYETSIVEWPKLSIEIYASKHQKDQARNWLIKARTSTMLWSIAQKEAANPAPLHQSQHS
jgi:hypothetical protein